MSRVFDIPTVTRVTVTDIELVRRATPADTAPFGELFDRHAGALYRYAWSLTRHTEDARDVVQEVFLVAWRKRATMSFISESALPWLLATCRHVALNSNRGRRRNPSVPVDPAVLAEFDLPVPVDVAASDELAAVRAAIAALSDVDRSLCRLCLEEGRTYVEAARELGLTPSTVGKRLERLRRRLRDSRTDYRKDTP